MKSDAEIMPITVPGSSSHSGALATACSGHSPLLHPEAKEAALDALQVSKNDVAARTVTGRAAGACAYLLVQGMEGLPYRQPDV